MATSCRNIYCDGAYFRRQRMITATLDREVSMAGPFTRGFKPFNHASTIQSRSSIYDPLLECYRQISQKVDDGTHSTNVTIQYEEISKRIAAIDKIYTPKEIQQFLIMTQCYEQDLGHSLSLIISALINKAHNDGATSFYFDLQGIKPLDYFCSCITKNQNTMLEIMVEGTVGEYCGFASHGGTYYIQDAGEWCTLGSSIGVFYITNGYDSNVFERHRGTLVKTPATIPNWHENWNFAKERILRAWS